MSGRIFPTSQDAENAFYEALERADLELMMAVWSEDEEIVCVHPGGPRLAGQDPVRASWAQIFSNGGRERRSSSSGSSASSPPPIMITLAAAISSGRWSTPSVR